MFGLICSSKAETHGFFWLFNLDSKQCSFFKIIICLREELRSFLQINVMFPYYPVALCITTLCHHISGEMQANLQHKQLCLPPENCRCLCLCLCSVLQELTGFFYFLFLLSCMSNTCTQYWVSPSCRKTPFSKLFFFCIPYAKCCLV